MSILPKQQETEDGKTLSKMEIVCIWLATTGAMAYIMAHVIAWSWR